MSYSNGHPVNLIGGRLALDFLNTADWSADGKVLHEKLQSLADLDVWLHALGLENVPALEDLAHLIRYRSDLRQLLLLGDKSHVLNDIRQFEIHDIGAIPENIQNQPLTALISASAIAILSDSRERSRIKQCPADNCGWLFLDETKNSRRTWCRMETCGNRAKAARHYAKHREKSV